ncbi:MAG: ThiF family adenylyltransferase [Amylibacter sp.]|nr:ThiF family adenylyltransferase [Amylibacter sp.]
MTNSLTLTAEQHAVLQKYLFPGDGLESAAILICRFCGPFNERLIVSQIINVPDDMCTQRTPKFISWPGGCIENAIDQAEQNGDAIILAHSHPGGMFAFSKIDNESDACTMPALFSAIGANGFLHGSAIMIPNGSMKARIYQNDGTNRPILHITKIGHDISDISVATPQQVMAFGSAMTKWLSEQTACVIGVSGTGSIVAELLARKGVGHLILIDFDTVEEKNLNRIVNSTTFDARQNRSKVAMMAEAIGKYSPSTKITSIHASLNDRDAVVAASAADILFSCVDSVSGRSVAELICQSCLIPLIDLGVTIPTRVDQKGDPQIADICGRIDFVRPDGPSLSDRLVVTPEGLRREYLLLHAPEAAEQEIEAGYIKGVHEEAPSVMALNMRAASDAVMEWLARQFCYRHDANACYARTIFSLSGGEVDYDSEHVRIPGSSGH